MPWTDALAADDIAPEGVARFDHGGRSYAIFHGPDGAFYCTAGLCTHEEVHLADGLVVDFEVECPKHGSLFDYRSGEAATPPACENLVTYPVRLVAGRVEIDI